MQNVRREECRAAPAGLDSSPSSIVFAERTAGMPMASGGERSASPLSRVAVDRRLALLCSAKCLFAGTAGDAERAVSTMSPVVPFATLIRTTTTTTTTPAPAPTLSPNNSATSGAPTICGCARKRRKLRPGRFRCFGILALVGWFRERRIHWNKPAGVNRATCPRGSLVAFYHNEIAGMNCATVSAVALHLSTKD